ncbi:MAG: bifunctional transaldolase/phosoglucose isomerase [Myxococcota bacterium]
MNPLEALAEQGQSIWLDYIRRGMTRGGELQRLVGDGLRGMTSNPSIFDEAIARSDDYADVLGDLVAAPDQDASDIYEFLALQDIREAADALRPVYDATDGVDGYVSLEVAPSLARDPDGTIEQARRLWAAAARPNVMIKVPGTPEGLPAIEVLLGEGINVNVTLIFSRGAYHSIAEAFMVGVERWIASGGEPKRLASVASFFVSRIDAEADARLEALSRRTDDEAHRAELRSLQGATAVANAKLAYEIYQRMLAAPRWRALAELGARPQRLLWASTGTKNPAYSDVKYVDELIGPDTVNTVPPHTLAAFRDHGTATNTLTQGVEEARETLQRLESLGVSMGELTDHLLERGVERFEDAMDGLLGTIAQLQRRHRGSRLNRLDARLPPALADAVGNAQSEWDRGENTKRLWHGDATLWTNSGEERWLAWLDVVDRQRKNVEHFATLTAEMAARGFEHVVVIGMGGSSLAADVLARVYGGGRGFPRVSIMDSTDPAQLQVATDALELPRTLFVVSSKSGTTLEAQLVLAHVYAAAELALGDEAPRHFLAITDPGTALEAFARTQGFWSVQHGMPDVGGRFSVFTNFGMVPAMAMGLPVIEFLEEAALMVGACGNTPARDNPGVELGLILGAAARRGRDKLTLITTPAIAPIGAWLEQLVAESTGKDGRAIIPHEREPLLDPEAYGRDRVFVYLRLHSTPHLDQDRAVAALASAGHPVVRLDLDDAWSLSQEFFRWQVAAAVAAAVLGVNPFDQPDVEASKAATRRLLETYERRSALPGEAPLWSGQGVTVFTNEKNAAALRGSVRDSPDLAAWLQAHFSRMRPRDYVALLAYLPMTLLHERVLHDIRSVVLESTGAATCVAFGPRFLHSTGQAFKGGPNTGVFVQLTCEDARDLNIPDRKPTFSIVKAAQARGDFEVLGQRGRRVLRIHLGTDVASGLQTVLTAVDSAMARRRDEQST